MLAAVPFIMVLGNSMLIPVLPQIQSALKLSEFQTGLIITAFSIPAGLTIPWAGVLSDRVGRKVVMGPALAVYGLGGLVSGLAALLLQERSFALVMTGRVIQGIGAGGTYQLAMALTGDIFKSRERTKALGLLEAANGLGKVVSPVAGAAAGLLAWFAPFWIYGLLALPIAAGVWFIVREPRQARSKVSIRRYFSNVGKVFQKKGPSLGTTFLAGLVGLFLLFGLLSYYSDALEQFGVRGFRKGFVIAGPVLLMAITSYLSGTVLQKRLVSLLKLISVVGLGLIAAGVLAVAFSVQPIWFFIAISVVGIGNGLLLPALNTMITSAADREERGAVTALYGTVRFFGVAIGPPVFGFALEGYRVPIMIGGAALAAAAAILLALFVRQKQMIPKRMRRDTERAEAEDRAAREAREGRDPVRI